MNTTIQIIFFSLRASNLHNSSNSNNSKQFVAILNPEPSLLPSSINQIANVRGLRFSYRDRYYFNIPIPN